MLNELLFGKVKCSVCVGQVGQSGQCVTDIAVVAVVVGRVVVEHVTTAGHVTTGQINKGVAVVEVEVASVTVEVAGVKVEVAGVEAGVASVANKLDFSKQLALIT